ADSKFFRCFAVVLILVLLTWPWHRKWPVWSMAAVGVPLFILTVWRYMEQRYKSTNQAYWSVITLAANAAKIQIEKQAPAPGTPSHAGGVVFRIRREFPSFWNFHAPEYLLVEAKDDPAELVLPKGHVEPGEHLKETAIREVLEETGVWGRILYDLGVHA